MKKVLLTESEYRKVCSILNEHGAGTPIKHRNDENRFGNEYKFDKEEALKKFGFGCNKAEKMYYEELTKYVDTRKDEFQELVKWIGLGDIEDVELEYDPHIGYQIVVECSRESIDLDCIKNLCKINKKFSYNGCEGFSFGLDNFDDDDFYDLEGLMVDNYGIMIQEVEPKQISKIQRKIYDEYNKDWEEYKRQLNIPMITKSMINADVKIGKERVKRYIDILLDAFEKVKKINQFNKKRKIEW